MSKTLTQRWSSSGMDFDISSDGWIVMDITMCIVGNSHIQMVIQKFISA